MRMRIFKNICLLAGILSATASFASGDMVHLEKVHNDLRDSASLQRGAAFFVNQCSGCHTLQHVRYNQLSSYLGMKAHPGEDAESAKKIKSDYEDMIQRNLNFVSGKVTDTMINAMRAQDAGAWFGKEPPDLTLVTRVRGKDWLYTYLKSFYLDSSRPWGVNNLAFPDVGMPHVLAGLQGLQTPLYETEVVQDENGGQSEKKIIVGLQLSQPGTMAPEEFDKAMTDLVNFLQYVAEPVKLERERLGVWVLFFLVIFIVFSYLLKREFWKDVH
jgi:ubiquinol-cytochrome c reductase cytochrome c1 subunit